MSATPLSAPDYELPDWLFSRVFAVSYNPAATEPWTVRLAGPSGELDSKPHETTQDSLGTGFTAKTAADRALSRTFMR